MERGPRGWTRHVAVHGMKKMEDKLSGWRQVQSVAIFLFVQYVRAAALLIEGHALRLRLLRLLRLRSLTRRQAAVSYSAGQHYDIGVCNASRNGIFQINPCSHMHTQTPFLPLTAHTLTYINLP